MILQNILFPSVDTCAEEHMYFRRNTKTSFSIPDGCIKMKKNGKVQFDTYFNFFNCEKWLKYTAAKSIKLCISIKGKVRISCFRKEYIPGRDTAGQPGKTISNSGVITEPLKELNYNTDSDERTEISLDFRSSSTNGMYGFSLSALENNAVFYGGYWYADLSEEEINPVKIAIDICTFKREKYVEANLDLLNRKFLENTLSPLYRKLEVFISDNAQTLDAEKLQTDNIHIFKNKNAGGSGGFTRGLIEINRVKGKKGFTHALLMDDDICIEPESIFRTFTMLSCMKNEYRNAFIGGAMLRLDERNIQTESGAVWNGGELISLKANLDLNRLNGVLFNELEESAQFNAWWYCAFPTSVVSDDNLPMPIFIRGDDVEYGLRNMEKLILLNGICVWHEPFEYKYSSSLFYYILRNRFIDNSIHGMAMPKNKAKKLLRKNVVEQLWLYRYKNADLIMDGVEDFLKGVGWLSMQDGEKINGSIMAKGYKLKSVDSLGNIPRFLYGKYLSSVDIPLKRDFISKVIRRITINGHRLRPVREYAVIPTVDARAESVYRTDTLLNYDYYGRKGFITKKDSAKAKQCMKRYRALCRLIDKKYDETVKDYQNNFRKLTDIQFWKKYLELDE